MVGGVQERAQALGVPVLAVAGEVDADLDHEIDAVSLVERYGDERARDDVQACITDAVAAALRERFPGEDFAAPSRA